MARGSVLLTPRFDNLCDSVSKQLDGAFKGSSGIGSKAGSETGQAYSTALSAKAGAVMGLVSSVTSKCFDAIASSLDSAISRVDTMNNFPRVLSGLGYSADDATKAVQKMGDHLTGLPTKLDAMTSSVQKIVPTVKDVGKSTDIMLAFNDALLAGGASTQVQEAALEQFTQVLSKGKPELEDWRSIVQAMPGQMDQVAKSLLGAGASSNDLYEAMKDGKVSVEQLEDAFVSLDSEGYNGFASFAEQAKSGTAGIATSLANAQNSITKFTAAIIDAIGTDVITAPIQAFTTAMKGASSTATALIGDVKAAIANLGESEAINELIYNADVIARCFRGIKDTAVEAFGGIVPTLSDVGAAIEYAAGCVNKLIDKEGGLGRFCQGIKALAPAIVPAGAALAAFLTGSVATGISQVPVLGTVLGGLTGPLSSLAGPVGIAIGLFAGMMATSSELRDSVTSAISAIATPVQNLATSVLPLVSPVLSTISAAVQLVASVLAQLIATLAPIVVQLLNTASILMTILTPAITSILTTIQTAMPLIQEIITVALANIQAIWDVVWPAIQPIVITVFSAISAVITGVMGVIQAVITTVMAAINGDWGGVWAGIQSVCAAVWAALGSIITGALGIISSAIDGALAIISGIWDACWSTISNAFSAIWDGIKTAASNGIDAVYNTVVGIKDKVVGFFSGCGSWLLESGKALLNGFKRGIENGFNAVRGAVEGGLSTIRSFFPFSPAKRGPFSGRGYTTYSGRALMGGLGEGIAAGAKVATDAAANALAGVSDQLNGGSLAFTASGRVASLAATRAMDARDEAAQGGITLGSINVDAHDLEDLMTVERFIDWLRAVSRARAMGVA